MNRFLGGVRVVFVSVAIWIPVSGDHGIPLTHVTHAARAGAAADGGGWMGFAGTRLTDGRGDHLGHIHIRRSHRQLHCDTVGNG
uniref:Putative secreted protein n=1 Tax=Anopheles triannulatus TaxID=58253 RepID=A0A2M4B192_9DIPT